MTFFNKKEDVISIELTPYGRSLLAKGKLKPAYYAFFDDDILYDAGAAGFSEDNNQIQTRIVDETPRLRPQRDLQSVEGSIFTNERSQENERPHTKMKLNYLTEPMGTSNQTSNNAPSWKITMVQGEITGSVEINLTGSNKYLRNIPQVDCTIEYTMQIRNISDDPPVSGQTTSPNVPASEVFDDGTYLEVLNEQILAEIKEDSGFILKDGFEVEVYLKDDAAEENYIPLKFLPKRTQIIDGFLVENATTDVEITPEYVEYYVDFITDGDISSADICKGLARLKANDLQIGIDIECEDDESIDYNIYGTAVTEVEICD